MVTLQLRMKHLLYQSSNFYLVFIYVSAVVTKVCCNFRKRKLSSDIFYILLLSLLTVANPINGAEIPFDNNKVAAIIVLAGSYSERVPIAVTLYHAGVSTRILLTNDGVRSRWSKKYQRNLLNVEWAEEMLSQAGVPASSIVKLPFSASGTVHDALAVKAHVSRFGVKQLVLVTSDYHVQRTLWTFRRVFREQPMTITAQGASSRLLSMPRLLEPIKMVYYYIRYGVLSDPSRMLPA